MVYENDGRIGKGGYLPPYFNKKKIERRFAGIRILKNFYLIFLNFNAFIPNWHRLNLKITKITKIFEL
jgi:hypothetical protein